ncbi:AAA family ATPase [Chitinimonas sp. JJ19]|uniref:AAA family ATPase n=1 Tax=Chitinimonas sp. JJ19 TaxID=3109352 RepID=UPI003000AF76
MRINKISIKNYRSCVDAKFNPHKSLTALIGPNGSGKTNILSAVRLLPALCYHPGRNYGGEEPISTTCEIKTWYEIDASFVIHTAKLYLTTNEKNQDEIIGSNESWTIPNGEKRRKRIDAPSWILHELVKQPQAQTTSSGIRKSHLNEFFTQRGISQNDLTVLEHAIRLMAGISYYSASQFTNPGNCPISFEVEMEGSNNRRTGISISGHKKFLYDLYQEHRTNSDSYLEYIDLIGENGIGLVESINFNEIETSKSSYSVMTGGKVLKREKQNLLIVPSITISGNGLSPSQLSEGTFKTLALIFYLVTDKSSILMIEEPEVCVHHGLLNSIMELIGIYSKSKQIFISTHSDSILDRLDIDNVFKVRREKELGTQISNIRENLRTKELTALKNYLLNEGSLGEFWKHGDLENV